MPEYWTSFTKEDVVMLNPQKHPYFIIQASDHPEASALVIGYAKLKGYKIRNPLFDNEGEFEPVYVQ
jgi:hypothetical protein